MNDGLGDEKLREEISQRLLDYCQEHGYRLSPQKDAIIEELVEMRKLFGDFYCPCQNEISLQAVCICSMTRDGMVEQLGTCFCDLIIK